MTTLFTDLDNTLLYSHRHPAPGPVRWVEQLHGKPQGYLTKSTYDFFLRQDWLSVVPVTTRTPAQFARLEGMIRPFGWRDALVCNGAILLRDGREDPAWSADSRTRAAGERPAFEAAYALACAMVGADALVCVSPFLFYVKAQEPEAVLAALLDQADTGRLTLLGDGRKVYCFPRSLDKGQAVQRYRARFGRTASIAAGDSVFDLPMLEAVERCFCPEAIAGQVANPNKTVCRDGPFSDLLCAGLEALRNEETSIEKSAREVQRGGPALHPCAESYHRPVGDPGAAGGTLLPSPVPGGHHFR